MTVGQRYRRAVSGALAAAALASPAGASADVGVNVSPGWSDTVDGRDIPQMEQVLADFRPHTARMPWIDNANQRETLRFNAANGIDSLVIDNATWTPEQVVNEIAAAGYPVVAVEGVNEPDVPATGYTLTPQPITAAKLAEVADRQARLYAAVAGRWPVLCPSAVYQINEAALGALPCDIVSLHRYHPSDGTAPAPSSAALPNVSKPIWVTETGISSYKKGPLCPFSGKYVVTPDQQATFLTSMIGMLRANGAERVFVYSLQNTGQNQCKAGNNFGLYTWDGVAKPSAAALRGT